MTTTVEPWKGGLERLIVAPMVGGAQVRFLFERLGAPRETALDVLWTRLADANRDRASDAAYVLENVLTAADRGWVAARVASDAPARPRAWLRALFQNGVAHGRLKDDEAEVPVPAADALPLFVEDVARHVATIPQPWQRARVAAESLVSDPPLPDDGAPAAVAALAGRLYVPEAQVWAELLIHPLTRPPFRGAATRALETPAQAAVPILESAEHALLPGPLHDACVAALGRHRDAAGGVAAHAAVSGADARGAVVVVLSVSGARSRGVAAVAWPGMTEGHWKQAEGSAVENLHQWAALHAASHGGLVDVPPATGVALCRQALEWLWNAEAPLKGKAVPGLRDAIESVALAAGIQESAAMTSSAAPAPFEPAVLFHPLVLAVELEGTDLSEGVRKELAKEMRARGRPKDATVAQACKDVAGRKTTVARLRAALAHAAAAAHARHDEAAPALAGLLRALDTPAEAAAVYAALLRKTVGVEDAPGAPVTPPPSARDELRGEILPSVPKGVHVLALDLAAAALDAARVTPRALDGLDEDRTTLLHADAGSLAARAVAEVTEGTTEESRLQEAAKVAIRKHAESLPSRQRRDLGDAWVRAWTELLTRACRGSCAHRCLSGLQEPRELAAYSLDHPRHGRPWP
ncbi:MAG: hypothetical protein HY904_12515 [Deltaproteobacteria bacterium]|nr:hypothetical protein [Deltaproteobacteria bacterium]